jgi:hypothetical protein
MCRVPVGTYRTCDDSGGIRCWIAGSCTAEDVDHDGARVGGRRYRGAGKALVGARLTAGYGVARSPGTTAKQDVAELGADNVGAAGRQGTVAERHDVVRGDEVRGSDKARTCMRRALM